MNFVEGSLTDTKHKRPLFFKADVGSALDQMRGIAVGNAGERSGAARDGDHGIGGIGTAGYIGADIGVGLELNLSRKAFARRTQNLADEVGAAFDVEFFGKHAEGAIGSDEVDGLNALFCGGGEKKMLEKNRTARAGGGDGEILRWVVEQSASARQWCTSKSGA